MLAPAEEEEAPKAKKSSEKTNEGPVLDLFNGSSEIIGTRNA